MIDPRYRNLKMNIQPEAQGVPAQPRGAFGGPPKRNWGRKAVLAMKAIAELDPRYRGGFAQQQAQFDAQDQRALQAPKEAERQAAIAEFAKTLTPEQQMLFGLNPNAAIEGMTQQAFSGPRDRKIVKGVDGKQYYEDTKEPVLPGVQATVDEMTPYQAEQIRLQQERLNFQKNRPVQNGISIGADGSIQIGGPAGAATTRQMAGQDAQQLASARQKVQDLQPVLNTMYAARAGAPAT